MRVKILTFSPQRQTDQFHVADGSTTAMWWAQACAILHKSWRHVRLKLPSPRKRLHLKFPIKSTGHGNFVFGRFHARAWNGLSVWDKSVYSHALPTDTPSPIFSEGRGWLYTGYLERIIPSSNCPSKLTDKVRRIVHSKLNLFHFQFEKFYLSDANHQTDNPSHTNNQSLVWKRPFLL